MQDYCSSLFQDFAAAFTSAGWRGQVIDLELQPGTEPTAEMVQEAAGLACARVNAGPQRQPPATRAVWTGRTAGAAAAQRL